MDKNPKNSKVNDRKTQSSKRNEVNLDEPALNKSHIIFLSLITLITILAPYFRGLYFDRDQQVFQVLTFLAFTAYMVYKCIFKERILIKTAYEYISIAFVIIYAVALFFSVNKQAAVNELLNYCMIFSLFFIISDTCKSNNSKIVVCWSIVALSVVVCALGIDSYIGGEIVGAVNGIIKKTGLTDLLGLEEFFFGLTVGQRINSVFQYPNTLGSFLTASVIITTTILITQKQIIAKIILSIAALIQIVTLILTLSRGAYIVFAIGIIMLLFVLPMHNKIKVFSFLSVNSVCALLLLYLGDYLSTQKEYKNIWILLFIFSVVSSLFYLFLDLIINKMKINIKRSHVLVITAFIIVIALTALIFVYNGSEPVLLSNSSDIGNSFSRSIKLEPGFEYVLQYSVQAGDNTEDSIPYKVRILSTSKKEILANRSTEIVSYNGKKTKGIERDEIRFTVPSESEIIYIAFDNLVKDSKVIINDARIIEPGTEKLVKKIPLKNKYIPDSIINRLANMTKSQSSLTRFAYYKDGLVLFRNNWLFGIGGGGWQYVYSISKSYEYYTKEAHNYFLQSIIETGIFGLIVLLALVIVLVFELIMRILKKKALNEKETVTESGILVSALCLLIHSAIDFDFSLISILMLFWVLIGLLNSKYRNSYDILYKDESEKTLIKYFDSFRNKVAEFRILKVRPIIAILLSIVLIFFPLGSLIAQAIYIKAGDEILQNNKGVIISKVKNAVTLAPFNEQFKIGYVNALLGSGELTEEKFNKVKEEISKIESLGQYNLQTIKELVLCFLRIGEIEKALNYVDRVTYLNPLNPKEWAYKTNIYMQIVSLYLSNDQYEEAQKTADKALEIPEQVQKINRENLKPFVLDKETIYRIERLKYIRDNIGTSELNKVNDLVFLQMDVDVNNDKIPDQWGIEAAPGNSIKIDNGSISVKMQKDRAYYIMSRELSISSGYTYRIQVQFSDKILDDQIYFSLDGVKGRHMLVQNGNLYEGVISIPSDASIESSRLRLWMKGNYKVKALKIFAE